MLETSFFIRMLTNNRFICFEMDNQIYFFGKRLSNLFLLSFCLKENCIMMTRNAWKDKLMQLFSVYDRYYREGSTDSAINSHARYTIW